MIDRNALLARIFRLLDAVTERSFLAAALARVSVGVMFASSGWGKLHGLAEFEAYFRSLGIPAAGVQAPFVAALECFGGAALVLGLGTRVFAPMLAGTMVVALLTVILKDPKNHAPGNLFYTPEWLLLVILLWLTAAGAGKASLDRVLVGRFRGRAP